MRSLLVVLGLALALGCEGAISGPRRDDSTLPPPPERELPSPSSRAPRLSHAQYENALRDLLGASEPLGLTVNFAPDITSSTFDNNGGDLGVTGTQWSDYQSAAEEAARRGTADTAALARVAGGAVPQDPVALVSMLGARVFRRPLSSAERDAHVALFAQGAGLYPALSPRLAGARLVLEALLQSPHFLYRLELSTRAEDGVIPLSAEELASRLSFALWQSTPDGALQAAAADGSLLSAEGFAAQVDRLLSHPRARDAAQAFHAQLLLQSKYADVTRSTALFPEFSLALRASMREEQVRFLDAVLFQRQGSLADLFTAPEGYVDQHLARVYDLPGTFGAGFDRVSFTDGRRGGLLTQVGFLSAFATSTESDPIHRGVFVNHRLLCAPLPAPPNMVPALPRPDPSVPRTLRQRITAFTGDGTCGQGCHSTMINPIGFAFEHYDALGRWRDTDNGLPVDARDTYFFDFTTPRTFDGALELGAAMATEPMAHRCYAQHWLQYLHGRGVTDADRPVVARVGGASHAQGLPVTRLLRLLVESESFKTRAVEELP